MSSYVLGTCLRWEWDARGMKIVGLVDIGKDVDLGVEEECGNGETMLGKMSKREEEAWLVLKGNMDSWNTTSWEMNIELVTNNQIQ